MRGTILLVVFFAFLFCAVILPQLRFYQLHLMLCENIVQNIELNDHIHDNSYGTCNEYV